MREQTNKILKTLCIYMLVITMMLSSLVGSWDVMAATVKAPTVNPVFYDATTISGANLAKAKVNKETVIATVHVTLKGEGGKVKATLTDNPTSGTTWKVDLPGGVKVEKGDTVTVYQQIGEDKSPEVTKTAQPSKASTVTLTMPTGEIWIEQTSSNIVNEDEQAEAVQMLKDANTSIAGDIKSVKFTIDGTQHAYYEVTYKDGSTPGKLEAPNLTIKQVTETSRSPEIGSITIVDNVVKGKLAGPGPFDGIKVQLVRRVNKDKAGQYCNEKGCKTDKDSSDPVEVTLQNDGSFSYTLQAGESLTLDQIVGVSVKEPHKFVSCSTTTVKPVIPEKTEVKDPRKLTADDKKAIDAAIRKAYTVNGESKLPNGTASGMEGIPAVIQFDDSGNVKIFSGNDVKGTWDSNYNFVPEKNDDGSYKLKDGAEPKITIAAKDLLKNIKPDAPEIKLNESDKTKININAKAVDTDANVITVSYTGSDDASKTLKATKADDGTWSITEGEGSVDKNGVVTLPKDKVKGGTDVTAKVTDKGGIADDDKTPLTSEPGTLTVKETKADKVEALGGLDPVALKKWVGEDPEWKKGVEASKSATEENKGKINELLKGAKFEDVTEENRNTSKEGDFEGKIKITFDDKSELVIEKQMLYVSNHVTSMDRKDKVPTNALDVEFKLGEGVKVDNTGSGAIEGNKDNPTSYSNYKVKPGTDLKTYKLPNLNVSIIDSINVSAQKGYEKPGWNVKNGQATTNFVANTGNNVFTATATAIKTFNVTLDPNNGSGSMDGATVKENGTYKLPENKFTPPDDNHEFAGWLIGDATTTTDPGTEITITSDTVIKASWKPIEFKVKFQTEAGASGTMEDKTVNKGSKYELPKPTFTPEEGKEFAGWKIEGQDGVKKVGDKIDITGDVTLTATWKDIMVNVSYDANGGSGKMEGKELKKGSTLKLPANGFTAPENKEFDGWEVNGKAQKVGDEITVNENTTVKAKWKPIMVDVSFDKGEGSGSKEKVSIAKGSEYTLPDGKEFTPPENKVFVGWKVGDSEEVKTAGTKITVKDNTKLTAVYEEKPVEITFDKGDGTGAMEKQTAKKGSKYTLPVSTFTAPENKEFEGWKVGDSEEVKAAGTEITVNDNTKLTAVYKDKTSGGTTPGTEDPGTKPGEEPGVKPSPDTQVYNPWWPIWFGSSEVKPATPAEPKVEYERGLHRKYLYGYKDHTVRPEGLITRAEAAALIARLAELDMSNNMKPNFKDTKSAWYNTAINAVVAKNLMFADKDGDFRPNEPITRGEFARALFFIDKKNNAVAPFADVKGHVYEEAINQAYGNDRIKGYPDGTFKPDATITRAEAATILNNYADRNVTFKGMVEVHKDVVKFTDINESHWAYYEIMEAANTHEYQREKGTIPETWLEILKK